MNTELMTYLSKDPKYKLVFDLSSSLDVESVDTGSFLAGALQWEIENRNLNMYASDSFRKMISQHAQDHSKYGWYAAIRNIGILFEPALSLNLETIVELISKDILLIIQAEGVVENDRFYFLSQQYNLSIDLSHLTYTIIE